MNVLGNFPGEPLRGSNLRNWLDSIKGIVDLTLISRGAVQYWDLTIQEQEGGNIKCYSIGYNEKNRSYCIKNRTDKIQKKDIKSEYKLIKHIEQIIVLRKHPDDIDYKDVLWKLI